MSDRLLVATRKGLFVLDRREQWSISQVGFLANNVSVVLADPRDGSLYAALDHGHFGTKLHRSQDGGQTWNEIACPAYPEQPADQVEKDAFGKPFEWKLARIWSLAAGDASQPGVLWCGTAPGGLFRSNDYGTSWEIVRSLWDHPLRKSWFGGGTDLPALHSICVDPRSQGQRVLLAVSCGGVWETVDGGQSWNCRGDGLRAAYMPPEKAFDPAIQDVHCLAMCAANPDMLWAQHHNGIFTSTDGAASWRELQNVGPSTFGFAVAAHPTNPRTAWFVPGVSDEHRLPPSDAVVVTRTRDGGQTLESLTNGLPSKHAYDLVFRHALDVDQTGDRVAFGSTTGSLWISEDGGDQWLTISEHLPPIYAVRFVKSA